MGLSTVVLAAPEWDSGPGIYFNMFVYRRYQVLLMHTSFTGGAA
jgi:hypothetical protein